MHFAIAFLLKLAWTSLALALASLLLGSLANRLNPKSYRLLAISGVAPLVVGVLFFGWHIAIPSQIWNSELSPLSSPLRSLAGYVDQTGYLDQTPQPDGQDNRPIEAKLQPAPPESSDRVSPPNQSVPNNSNRSPLTAKSIATTLFLIWLAGVIWKLYSGCLRYASLCRLRTAEFTIAPSSAATKWHYLLKQSGKAETPVYESSVIGPALCCFPSGHALVLPRELWLQAADSNRELVLRHELAHYKHHHLFKIAICRALASIHWFNPLAKHCVARFERACEWQADDEAIQKSDELAVRLANSLVHFQRNPMSISLFGITAELAQVDSPLKTRVVRLLSSHHDKETTILNQLIVAVAIVLIVTLSTIRPTVHAQAASPAKASETKTETNSVTDTQAEVTGLSNAEDENAQARENARTQLSESGQKQVVAKKNPYQILFDEVARLPDPHPLNIDLIQQAFSNKLGHFKEGIQFKSLTSIRRTESANGEITYEFNIDRLEFFQEVAYLVSGQEHVADEILDGCLRDNNGPKIDLRKILLHDLKPAAKLVCQFIDERNVRLLVEVELADQAAFIPKLKQLFSREPSHRPLKQDYSHVLLHHLNEGNQISSEFGGQPDEQPQSKSTAVAVHKQRVYWGTPELVEQAISR